MSDHGTDCCPNCRQKGHADISAAESGGEYDTWMCDNGNCRVARYYVEPITEQSNADDSNE